MNLMAWQLGDRDKVVICFLLFCKREIIFETIFWIAGTQNQVPDRFFSFEVPLIAPVIVRTALC